jgi:hypothetical protein
MLRPATPFGLGGTKSCSSTRSALANQQIKPNPSLASTGSALRMRKLTSTTNPLSGTMRTTVPRPRSWLFLVAWPVKLGRVSTTEMFDPTGGMRTASMNAPRSLISRVEPVPLQFLPSLSCQAK